MPDFSHRSTEEEIMDNFSLEPKEIDPVLKELETIKYSKISLFFFVEFN